MILNLVCSLGSSFHVFTLIITITLSYGQKHMQANACFVLLMHIVYNVYFILVHRLKKIKEWIEIEKFTHWKMKAKMHVCCCLIVVGWMLQNIQNRHKSGWKVLIVPNLYRSIILVLFICIKTCVWLNECQGILYPTKYLIEQ